jgi:hypothetical protein
MRNKLFLIGILLPVILGCGMIDEAKNAATGSNSSNVAANVNANKTLTDKAVDAAVGDQKIGIPECDEALDILSAQADNPDDNFVTKAVKKTALTTFRDQLKKQIEQQNHDRTEVAKFCREFRDNMEKSLNQNSNTAK